MTVEYYTTRGCDNNLIVCSGDEAEYVSVYSYEQLKKATKMALEALEWCWGGEPLPTLEKEAIDELKRVLGDE